jgi:hypothetical protein
VDDRRLLNPDTDPTEEVERIAAEFREGFAELAKIDRPAVTMFGSARIPEGHPSTRRRAPSGAGSPSPAGR